MKKTFNIASAISYHKNGDLRQAKRIYNQLIDLEPNNHFLIYLLGLIEYQEHQFEKALKYFHSAISLSPASAEYHKEAGNCYKHLNKNNLAIEYLERAIKIKYNFPEAHYDLGIIFLRIEKQNFAIDRFNAAISINPQYINAYNNLAVAYEKKKEYFKAIDTYKKALLIEPKNVVINFNLANILHLVGQTDHAKATLKKVIETAPKFLDAYISLGIIHREEKDDINAIRYFEKAISIEPLNDTCYLILGQIYHDRGKYNTAIRWFDKALKIDPNNALIHSGKGQSLYENGQALEAIHSFHRALEIAPKLESAYVGLIKVQSNSCNWERIEEHGKKLDHILSRSLKNGQKICETPFQNIVRHSNLELNYRVAKSHSDYVSEKVRKYNIKFDFSDRRERKSKVHIGYLSNNFRNHPTANLLLDIFENHNKKDFKISCYSYGPNDNSLQRQQIESSCDSFVDIQHLNSVEAAKKIFHDHVDILVDLVGYIRDGRIDIPALHPAPIQMRWLGLAGTTGASFFDYIISDKIVTPARDSKYYSENFIYLSNCYQINSYRKYTSIEANRQKWGLPLDFFIFCSFNAAYKIDERIFKCWLNILKHIPKSLLWLMLDNDHAEDNLKQYAKKNGVALDQIRFSKRVSHKEHIERLACADLALDTLKVNGAATTSDALWAGVPVLTIKGDHFASRMSSSLLSAVGLSDLIVDNLQEYQEKAILFARNPQLMIPFKKKMDSDLYINFFDTKNRVVLLEKAFMRSWNKFIHGHLPISFEVHGQQY